MKFYSLLLFLISFKIVSIAQSGSFDIPMVNLTVNKGFDYAYSFTVDQKPHMFCYDSQTGKAALWNLLQGTNPTMSMVIGKDWDYLSFLNKKGKSLYLFASSNTGTIRVVTDVLELSSLSSKAFQRNYDSNWSFVNTIEIDANTYLARYHKDTGVFILNEIGINNSSIDDINLKFILESGWDYFDYTNVADGVYFLKHSITTNRIVIEKSLVNYPEGTPDSIRLKKLFTSNQRIDYEPQIKCTHSRIFKKGDRVFLVLYNDKNGEIQILSISQGLKSFVSIYKTTWLKGWTNFNVIYLNDEPYLFHQKESNGLARISKIGIEL